MIYQTTAERNASVDAFTARLNNGTLVFYVGTRPAEKTLGGGETTLATATFGNPAFGAASNGTATANAITGDASIDASGTCGFAFSYESDGTTVVGNHSVGLSGSGADIILQSLTFVEGIPLTISSFTITMPAGT